MDRIGLIAGNGSFPFLFAREAKSRGIQVHAVAHRGETDPALVREVDSLAWVRVGQLGHMIRAFRRARVSRAVMAGGLNKVRSLASVRPDLRGLRFLGRVARGDDAILRGLAEELAKDGIEIVPSTLFLDRLVPGRGLLAGPPPDSRIRADVKLGCSVLAALGDRDVGQSVVVEDGVVLAIEAVEGTDATIARGGALGRGGAVLVKVAKRDQDMRFDVPAVGVRTLHQMMNHGVTTLALEAGRAIVLDDLASDRPVASAGSDTEGLAPSAGAQKGRVHEESDFLSVASLSGVTVVGCSAEGEVEDV